jgi:hypothetical protein
MPVLLVVGVLALATIVGVAAGRDEVRALRKAVAVRTARRGRR